MRLKKAQKEKLLEWIAEGLTSDEVNNRAADFEDPFNVSRQQVDHYRKTRGIEIAELQKLTEHKALNVGLSKKSTRVQLLKDLAEKLTDDLFNKGLLWTDMVKGIGSRDDFQVVEYEEFNAAEVAQLRGVLDDIAKEVGDRKGGIDITSQGKQILNDTERYDRAISGLADAIREIVPGEGSKRNGSVDAAEQTSVDGATIEG